MSEEQNKATFQRYVEGAGNEGNLELTDEIFDRYLAHQSTVPCWSAVPRTSSGS